MISFMGRVRLVPTANPEHLERVRVSFAGRNYAILDPHPGVIVGLSRDPHEIQYKTFQDGIVIAVYGNIVELTKSSVQSVYDAYVSGNPGRAALLNGHYAAFIFDPSQRTVSLAIDRLGSKLLFYTILDGYLIFANRLDAFPDRTKPNVRAIADMISSGVFHHDDTYLDGVHRLLGASFLTVNLNSGKIEKRRLWVFTPGNHGQIRGLHSIKHDLSDLITQAVERQTRGVSRVGILLSGGIDSRVILGACRQLGIEPVLFSYYWRDIPGSDVDIARHLARITRCQIVPLRYADPTLDDANEHSMIYSGIRAPADEYSIVEKIRGYVDCLLIGHEAFGWVDFNLPNEDSILASVGIRRLSQSEKWRQILNSRYYDSLVGLNNESVCHLLKASEHLEHPHDRKDFLYVNERLPKRVLPLQTMYEPVSRPASPLLDHDILDFVSSLPPENRLDKSLFSIVAREMYPDLFRVPVATASGMHDFEFHWRSESAIPDGTSPVDILFDRHAVESIFDAPQMSIGDLARRYVLQSAKGAVGAYVRRLYRMAGVASRRVRSANPRREPTNRRIVRTVAQIRYVARSLSVRPPF